MKAGQLQDVVGTYTGQDGREIRLAEDGIFSEIPDSLGGFRPGTLRYWVTGNSITIGASKSRPNVSPTFKVEGNNRLVGDSTVWIKQSVKPNRPSSLVGTYTSSDGESLALDKNGSIYDSQQLPTGSSARTGIWVAGNDAVKVTYSEEATTYTISGNNLVGGGKEFVKKSNDTIVPVMP